MRHVGLLGLGQSLEEAPFGDPQIEFWGLSNGHSIFPNWAVRRWFEMHDIKICEKRDPEYIEWARACDRPLYMLSHDARIPASVPYPRWAALRAIQRPYVTSTVAWMLGMVLLETDITEVSLWGINLSAAEEYRRQRPCVEYLLGRLEGRGTRVNVATGSIVLKDGMLYGYEELTEHADLIRKYAIGGTDSIIVNGAQIHGIYVDPVPSMKAETPCPSR